ncbi:MAG: tetratricopeptide repeat protein, partial [Anaerolineales bacterium]|nr:tetratricopeptide repeat protein [Anaerolineales bacterium]
MALKLLSTKLFVPAPRSNLVSRPRLVATLNASLAVKLTLVSAPAGFGKSTLLSEWAASCGRPVAWLALDEGDNDPMRFMAYFTAALQTINARIGQGTPRPPAIEDAMTELVNEIAHLLGEATPGSPRAARLESGLVLILDDYHAINARPIHEALIPLIDHMPPGMHLVIAARSDPPLPIPRLRARGEMVELRQSDLRFTAEEAAEFLNRVMSLELSAEDVAALASRTEGWIAGLQMAALSMQGSADTQAFIQAFTGSNRYILDYLVEEVLKRQPEPVQRFLLETSILERLCAPLCDAVLSSQVSAVEFSPASISPGHLEPLQPRSRSQPILEYLERANLFIVALDDRREWYRYHQLFAEFLRNRLKRDLPGEQPGLHCRAAAWFEKNGFAAEAVEHALNSGDLDYAAQLVDAIAETTLMSSQVTSLMNWIEALPEAAVNARPSLCLHHAWALLLSGYPLDVVEERLEYAASDTERNQGRVEGLRAFVAAFQGNVPLAVELSRKALERMREDDPFLRGVVAWNLGISSVWSSDLPAGYRALEEAVQVGLQTGNQMVAVVALSHLAELRMNMGELNEAQTQYQRALALAVDSEGRRLPIAGAALIGLGEVLRKRNQLQKALEHIREGLHLTQQWGKIGTLDGYIALARIKQASGDSHSARQEIQKALEIANRF